MRSSGPAQCFGTCLLCSFLVDSTALSGPHAFPRFNISHSPLCLSDSPRDRHDASARSLNNARLLPELPASLPPSLVRKRPGGGIRPWESTASASGIQLGGAAAGRRDAPRGWTGRWRFEGAPGTEESRNDEEWQEWQEWEKLTRYDCNVCCFVSCERSGIGRRNGELTPSPSLAGLRELSCEA